MVAPLISAYVPSAASDFDHCQVTPVTPPSGSTGVSARISIPILGCDALRDTIPRSSTLVTVTVTSTVVLFSAAPTGVPVEAAFTVTS